MKGYAKISVAYDIKNGKFCADLNRTKRAHDIREVKYLLRRVGKLSNFYADSAYDAEWI